MRSGADLDTTQLRVQNVSLYGEVNSYWEERLYDFCQKEITKSVEPKWQNYQPSGLDLKGHLTFDVLLLGDEILSFAGVYNGGRYSEGVYRILNRSYTRPQYRSPGLALRLLNSQFLVPLQIERHMSELDLIFVSIQEAHLRKAFPRIVGQIKSEYLNNWQLALNMVEVAPHPIRSCYQNVMYHHLSQRYAELPLKQISSSDYWALPEELPMSYWEQF